MQKTIAIEYETWKKLLVLKAERNSRSLDDVINSLLKYAMGRLELPQKSHGPIGNQEVLANG